MLRFAAGLFFLAAGVEAAPPLLVVGVDGFRHDWFERSPVLKSLAKEGVRVRRMEPVFPSTTFPNFHSMSTGLLPERHGMAAMEFIEPSTGERFSYRKNAREGKWFQGKPFWEIAEDHGIRTATFFWVGTDAGINGRFPGSYRQYDPTVQHREKLDTALGWLQEGYGLVVVYFADVDSAGHAHGPDAPEVAEAIEKVDRTLGQLIAGARAVRPGVNVLVVSDHGMSAVERVLDLSREADFTGCRAANEGPMTRIYCRDAARTAEIEKALRAKGGSYEVRRGKGRSGDLLLVPTCRCITNVTIPGDDAGTVPPLKGMHGYDASREDEMNGLLVGAGPAFARGPSIEKARNPDVFAVILRALSLPVPRDVDANPRRVDALFAPH